MDQTNLDVTARVSSSWLEVKRRHLPRLLIQSVSLYCTRHDPYRRMYNIQHTKLNPLAKYVPMSGIKVEQIDF